MSGYLWIKAAHIIAVIAWMAGLLYLPRLFVYHAEAPKGSAQSETFKVMERRLLKAIMTPAMLAVWILGLVLISVYNVGISDGTFWLYGKLLIVIFLTGIHMHLGKCARNFATDENAKTSRYFRIINEVPAFLMVVIVVLVVVKPL